MKKTGKLLFLMMTLLLSSSLLMAQSTNLDVKKVQQAKIALEKQMILEQEAPPAPVELNESSGETGKQLFEPIEAQWDLLEHFDVQTPINETGCLGAEFDGTNYWVTARGQNAPNHLVAKFDLTGNLVTTYPHSSASAWGIRDLAYDGTYIYGGDDYGFYQIDPASGSITTTWASPPSNFPRAVAWVPTIGQFICGNFGNDWYTFNADGTGQTPVTNPGLSGVYGMAYDSWNDVVWVFDQSGTPQTTIYEYDYNAGTLTGVSYQLPNIGASTDQLAGGLWYAENHPNYGGFGVLGGLTQGTPLDLHFVLELNLVADPDAPDAVTGLSGTPGAMGALEATIDWTNPTLQVDGDPLTELTSVELSRDGTVIYTNNSPTIGGVESFFDNTVPSAGMYTYQAVGYNSMGMGIPSSVDVWVGPDVPAAVTSLTLTPSGSDGVLNWTNPTTGLHGGYFTGVTGYEITRVEDGTVFNIGGPATTWTDNTIPYSGYWTYTVVTENAQGQGGSATSNTALIVSPVSSFPYNEGWESGLGAWLQDPGDDFDWTQNSGGTGSTGTGPSAAYAGTYYLYTESSSPNYPSKTAIISAAFDFSSISGDLNFDWAYHMYGAGMGTLSLEASTDNGTTWNTLWTMSGDQGNMWHLAGVPLNSYAGMSNVLLRWNGLTGSSYTSDMSLDDLYIYEPTTPPPCSNPVQPTDGAVDVLETTDLVWSAAPSATGYLIYFGTDNPPTNIENGTDLGNVTSYTPPSTLTYSTDYYWKIVPYNGNGNASGCPVWSFTVRDDPTQVLPFCEDLTACTWPNGWMQTSDPGTVWSVNNSANAGGSACEFALSWTSGTGFTRLITPPIITTGVGSMDLDFNTFFDDYGAGLTVKVQSSSDMVTWTDEAWSYASGSGNLGPITVNTTVSNNMNGTTYVAFVVEGDHFQFDAWYIDDICFSAPQPDDVGTFSIDVAGLLGTGAFDPQATVKNFGTNTQTFDVTMTITPGGYSSTKTVTALTSGATQQVTFDTWNPAIGSYQIDVCTQLSGDMVPANDCMTGYTDVMDLQDKVVYGYNAYDPTASVPDGPVWFNLLSPGTINSIADQSAMNPSFAGTWADGVWYHAIYTENNLVTIDPITGARTVVGALGAAINGLAYDPVADVLYGIDYDAGVPGQTGLYTIDMATGAATLIGGTSGGQLLINLASPSTGGLYSVDIATDEFGMIDPATGAFTVIGPIGFDANYAQDMEFDRDNDACWMAAYNNGGSGGELRLVSMGSGNTTLIGGFQGGMEMCGFAIPYSGGIELDLTVLLEGPYDDATDLMATDMNTAMIIPDDQPYNMAPWNYAGTESVSGMPSANVVDWVLIELRETTTDDPATATGSTMIAQRAGFILDDGSIVDTDGSSTLHFDVQVNDYLYVVVTHRNHLDVISSVSLTEMGGVYTYDFTTDANTVYGGNLAHKELEPGVWGLVAGDGDADGQVASADKNNVWYPEAGNAGYLMGDFNLDTQVETQDKNTVWYFNAGLGSQVPDSAIPEGGYHSHVPK